MQLVKEVEELSKENQEAIRFEHVYYSVNGDQILINITGHFPKGRITAIVGPSGTGKSTLFRLCNGLASPDCGDIFIYGKNVADYDPVSLRRLVGLAPQNAPMIDGTVFSNLELPFLLQGKRLDKAEAKALLRRVGLDESYVDHEADQLSGGERQRVSIARTLANRPPILLLDEITSSLDPASQQEIEKFIKDVNRTDGTTILWITHQMDQALRVGDYTWVMMDKGLTESGPISILEDTENLRVKQFLKGEIQ